MDTIHALSSGQPPAAIAILRISGPGAGEVTRRLAGALPPPRRPSLRTIRDDAGVALDRALVLFFPGPGSATGEDLVELHLHGGRAVIAAVERALVATGLTRRAEPGEFTRRALEHGRIDLAQAQGLADLLAAETEAERRRAFAASEGAVGHAIRGWMDRVAGIGALIESALDFSDEEDVDLAAYDRARAEAGDLTAEIATVLARPTVERLRDGARVVLAGPPNAGKSSLLNAMIGRDAAIVTPIAGTTRDVIEAPVVRAGVPYLLIDTAGLHDAAIDAVEQIGMDRAADMIERADVLLWLGDPAAAPEGSIRLHPQCDVPDRQVAPVGTMAVSAHRPDSVAALWDVVADRVGGTFTDPELVFAERQREAVIEAVAELGHIIVEDDALVAAEHCRATARTLGTILGINATEAMLDALFSRFCIGK